MTRGMRHVARIEEMGNMDEVLVGKYEENKQDNIKIDLKEVVIRFNGLELINTSVNCELMRARQ
jgi:hypothetical protein